jgi:hypothetical protein
MGTAIIRDSWGCEQLSILSVLITQCLPSPLPLSRVGARVLRLGALVRRRSLFLSGELPQHFSCQRRAVDSAPLIHDARAVYPHP